MIATCSNRIGCKLGCAGSQIRFDKSAICPECGQPLMIVSNSGMRKGAQTLTWLALIQLFPVLTLVENWLVMAGVLPYPISPEAVSFQNCYIVIEAILFLLLIAVLLIRYVRFPKDWVSWYATGSLLIFGLFQLTVFAAFGAKTLFDSDVGFHALLELIAWAAFPLVILSLLSLLLVCMAKVGWNTVLTSTSLVVGSLFLTVLSGVIGVVQIPNSGFWLSMNHGGALWIASWSNIIIGLAWVSPIRFARAESRGERTHETKSEGASGIASRGS